MSLESLKNHRPLYVFLLLAGLNPGLASAQSTLECVTAATYGAIPATRESSPAETFRLIAEEPTPELRTEIASNARREIRRLYGVDESNRHLETIYAAPVVSPTARAELANAAEALSRVLDDMVARGEDPTPMVPIPRITTSAVSRATPESGRPSPQVAQQEYTEALSAQPTWIRAIHHGRLGEDFLQESVRRAGDLSRHRNLPKLHEGGTPISQPSGVELGRRQSLTFHSLPDQTYATLFERPLASIPDNTPGPARRVVIRNLNHPNEDARKGAYLTLQESVVAEVLGFDGIPRARVAELNGEVVVASEFVEGVSTRLRSATLPNGQVQRQGIHSVTTESVNGMKAFKFLMSDPDGHPGNFTLVPLPDRPGWSRLVGFDADGAGHDLIPTEWGRIGTGLPDEIPQSFLREIGDNTPAGEASFLDRIQTLAELRGAPFTAPQLTRIKLRRRALLIHRDRPQASR